MHFKELAVASLFASVAAAAPHEVQVLKRSVRPSAGATSASAAPAAASAAASGVPAPPANTLAPAPPAAPWNFKNMEHLKATTGTSMRFDQDPSPDTDSAVADVWSDETQFPVVQLEQTDFIKKLSCTANKATVEFTNKEAFNVASKDWATHDQFVMMANDPKCGKNFDKSERDFMMVKGVKGDAAKNTVNADIEFVTMWEAIGKETKLKVDLGYFQANATNGGRQNLKARQPNIFGDAFNTVVEGAKDIGEGIVDTAEDVGEAVVDTAEDVGEAVTDTAEGAVDAVGEAISDITSGSESAEFNWDSFPTNTLTDDRFGPGFEVFNTDTFNLQCVGCGTAGKITITGTLEVGFFEVDKAELLIEGNMRAVAKMGLIANGATVSVPVADVQLASIPLSPLNIPGLATVGPSISIGAGAEVTIEATGDVVAGVELNWPNIKATIDAKNNNANAEGFSPEVTPVNEVNGEIAVTVRMGLPVSLAVGIDIANGLLEAEIALVDEPGVQVTGAADDQVCAASLNVEAFNDVFVDILGLTAIDIATFTTPIFSTCFSEVVPTEEPAPFPVPNNGSALVIPPVPVGEPAAEESGAAEESAAVSDSAAPASDAAPEATDAAANSGAPADAPAPTAAPGGGDNNNNNDNNGGGRRRGGRA